MDKKSKKVAVEKGKKVKNESSEGESEGSADEIVTARPNKMSMFQLLNVEEPDDSSSNDSEDEPVQLKKPVKKNAKKAGKKQGDDDDDADINNEEVVSTKPQSGGKKPAAPTGKNKKGGKKKQEEEDLDAILAELSLTNEQSAKKEGSKKEKKGKKSTDAKMEETAAESLEAEKPSQPSGLTVELKPNMTQEEIAKAMEEMYADDSEEEKKNKKKKAGKKAAAKPAVNDNKELDEELAGTEEEGEGDDEEGGTIKTAAQKKREKKERQKQERLQKTKGKSDAPAADKAEKTSKKADKPTGEKAAAPTDQEKVSEPSNQSAAAKESATNGSPAAAVATEATAAETDAEAGDKDAAVAEEETGTDGKKKSKKEREREKNKKKPEKEEKTTEKKPSKMVKQMQEELRLRKELEEQQKREEEERIRKEEEAIQQKQDKERLEKERKEREKMKKQEKIKRQKAEGTYLTPKERESRRRAQQMLEAMKAQGVEVPQIGGGADAVPDKPKRVVYDSRPKKKQQQQQQEEGEASGTISQQESVEADGGEQTTEAEKEESPDSVSQSEEAVAEEAPEEEEDVKDAWDATSSEEEEEEEEEGESKADESNAKPESTAKSEAAVAKKAAASAKKEDEEESDDEDDDEEDSDDDDDDDDEDSEEEDGRSNKEKIRERALARIQKFKEEAEAKRSPDNLRAPVVCVLGHVDTGKTKILDKLRRTNVQDGEAGGITQQIGATNVPQDTIKEQTRMCKEFTKKELKIPGLLIIDTPGHESFSNLRSRGSSLCDIAVLVVDIMHGLEPQTIESINLLKSRKTPFVVALNKVDRLFQWQTTPQSDVANTIKKQKSNTKLEFDERAQIATMQLAEQGLNAALFYENKNIREYINVIPTSAQTGDGMGNLIAVICDLTQQMLYRQLMFSEELKATVMEVKALPGLGTTIDVILVSGELHEGETIIVAGQEGPIVTQIRALLMPQPLRELRVKSAYEHHKTVRAAQGCKIVSKDLERALAGLPLFVAKHPDEIDIYKEEVAELLKEVLGSIKVAEKGVFVQASTLGSLEALLEFLKSQQIPYAGINIGPVHKRDITKASVMLEREEQYATILAFDVKVEREAQEMADNLGVRIFTADIIYHLFDKFTAYRDDYKKRKQEEFKHIAVFPCKLRILPQCIFKSRDPIVIGVTVEAGFLKEGTVICVPTKEFVDLGRVSSIEVNHKAVDRAVKGQEVCIKIDPIPGDAPKMFGRHFEATDILVSKISRASIDAVKNYFRDDLSKADWVLMVELKKTFDIL